LLVLDANGDALRKAINSAVNSAYKLRAISQKEQTKTKTQSARLFKALWESVWLYPAKVTDCTTGKSCITTSYENSLAIYEKNFAALKALADSVSKKLRKSKTSRVKRLGTTLSSKVTRAQQDSVQSTALLPKTVKFCN